MAGTTYSHLLWRWFSSGGVALLPSASAAQPQLFLSPIPVAQGQWLRVRGTGFTPNATVRVGVNLPVQPCPPVCTQTPRTQSVTTSDTGTFVVCFFAPSNTPSGNYRISAQVSTFTPIRSHFYVG